MILVNYIATISIPGLILIIILYGIIEKRKVFDDFIEGVLEGVEIVKSIFPTLLGIFLAVGCLRSSGILEIIVNILSPIANKLNFPSEIIPLAIIRPISGSAAMGVAIDILNNNGVDSQIGMIASTIMGATETTFYTIAIYVNSVGIKKIRFILIPALLADFVGIITAVVICKIMY